MGRYSSNQQSNSSNSTTIHGPTQLQLDNDKITTMLYPQETILYPYSVCIVLILILTILIFHDYIPLKHHQTLAHPISLNHINPTILHLSQLNMTIGHWTLDYVKDPWIQTTCMISNDEGSRSIDLSIPSFKTKYG